MGEQINLPLGRHECGHVFGHSLPLPQQRGADRVLVRTGVDAHGFYAETLGYWRNNDGSLRVMPKHPLVTCLGPSVTLVMDDRVTLTRVEALQHPIAAFGATADMGVAFEDWDDFVSFNLSPSARDYYIRAALLLTITFETLIRALAYATVRQLNVEGLPAAEFDPQFIREHVTGLDQLTNLAKHPYLFSDADGCADVVRAMEELGRNYAGVLSRPYLGTPHGTA